MTGFLAFKGHAWLALAARFYLGAVFLLACAHKILHPESFAVDVATYRILPLWSINLVAVILPWVELAAGLMLVLGFRARAGALMAGGMMSVFLAALASALARGLDMSCGCFASEGAEADPISALTVLRDLGWLALAAYVVVFDRQPIGLDRWVFRRKP
jgi:uncharacterized membrane protein YphA (DoxX/SURF4 family)